MTGAELEQLIKRADKDLAKLTKLIAGSKKQIDTQEKERSQELKKLNKSHPILKAAIGEEAKPVLEKEKEKRKKNIEQLEKDIYSLKHEVIPRLEKEKAELEATLGELKKAQETLNEMLEKAEHFKTKLDSIMYAAEHESI